MSRLSKYCSVSHLKVSWQLLIYKWVTSKDFVCAWKCKMRSMLGSLWWCSACPKGYEHFFWAPLLSHINTKLAVVLWKSNSDLEIIETVVMPWISPLEDDKDSLMPSTGLEPDEWVNGSSKSLGSPVDIVHACVASPPLKDASLDPNRELWQPWIFCMIFIPSSWGKLTDATNYLRAGSRFWNAWDMVMGL